MTDCNEIRDLLDAYSLGALSPEETVKVEEHVADCVRCWEELGKAQQTAALLALSVPMHDPPEHLTERILAKARRDLAGIRSEPRQPLLQRLRVSWASAAVGLGVASVAALAFAGVLQAQVNDLRDENDRLATQVRATNQEMEQRLRDTANSLGAQDAVIRTFLAEEDAVVELKPAGDEADARVWYLWAGDEREGWVLCDHLLPAPEGMEYQVWFSQSSDRIPVVALTPENGSCQVQVDLTAVSVTPTGIGISLEEANKEPERPKGYLAYVHFDD
jgi:hypothetical protein